jgi:hypothetical protein
MRFALVCLTALLICMQAENATANPNRIPLPSRSRDDQPNLDDRKPSPPQSAAPQHTGAIAAPAPVMSPPPAVSPPMLPPPDIQIQTPQSNDKQKERIKSPMLILNNNPVR